LNDPDTFCGLLDLLDLPQKEKYFLVVHHDLRREQGLHRFKLLERILQIKTIPTLGSSSIINLFGQKSIQYSSSIGLLISQKKVGEALANCIADVAIKRVLVDLVFFLAEFFLETVVEMLNEITFSAEEEMSHTMEMFLQMKLLLQYINKNSTDLLMGFIEPLVELSTNDAISTFGFGKLCPQVVNYFASIA